MTALAHYTEQVGKKFDSTECRIPGCEKPRGRRRWCGMHYGRFVRYGDPLFTQHSGEAHLGSSGYRVLTRPDHPLAGKGGLVYEHRLVLFAVIGDGTHPCHWCRKPVTWGDNLYVDHLDDDPVNNTPANLVPSCNSCNLVRDKAPESTRRPRANRG